MHKTMSCDRNLLPPDSCHSEEKIAYQTPCKPREIIQTEQQLPVRSLPRHLELASCFVWNSSGENLQTIENENTPKSQAFELQASST